MSKVISECICNIYKEFFCTQEFSMATIRFQIELGAVEDVSVYIGGRCISCHTYSISSVLGEEGEDSELFMIINLINSLFHIKFINAQRLGLTLKQHSPTANLR